jgi:AraC-like DNA-binding protein
MKERLGDELDLDGIASEAGLSRPHFYKLFRENVGITPNVYLNTLRMELAIDRLVKTDEPVTSIGLDLGFASQASFTRFFGANAGIPPTDYRRVAHVY